LALLESDLVKAFKKKDAKPNLALWRAFVRTQAAYMGVQPEALFAEIEVRVRRRVEAGASPLEAATPAVEAERAEGEGTEALEEAPAVEPAEIAPRVQVEQAEGGARIVYRQDAFDALLSRVKQKRAAINAVIEGGPRPVQFVARDGGMILVSEDPSKPGRWRATKIDKAGEPTGHIEAADFAG